MNQQHIQQLKIVTFEKLPYLLERSSDSVALYRNLCEYLVKAARKFNYLGITKYKIEEYVPGKNGFLDIIWVDEMGKIKVAITVDGALRTRSLKKLKNLDAEWKIFIYYGNSVGLKRFLEKNDTEGEVNIINLGHHRKDVRPKKKSKVSVFF